MNSKDIENKIKGLYKSVDPKWKKLSDRMILANELKGIEWSNKFKDPDYKKNYAKNVSRSKPNNVSEKEAFEIYYACLEPREEVRTAKFMTKLGKKYNLNLEQTRKIAYGDHYAFGGERITEKNIRVNHTKINPKQDLENWKNIVIGKFKFTSPEGKVYEFNDFEECGLWMQSLDNTSGNPYMKCYKKFNEKPLNTPFLLKQRFWKGWTIERIKNEN